MKKLLLTIFLILAFAGQGWGASYYAQAGCEITACEWDTTPTGGGSDLSWASLANGDNLYANGQTITIANDVGSGSVTVNLLTTAGAGTAGGTFTYDASAVSAKVLYTNLTAGSEHCLQISGAAAEGKAVEIIGTITGSSTTNSKYGVYDTHTGATSYIVATGAKSAGANVGATGYYSSGATGYHTLTGNATGVYGSGISINTATAGSTQAGDCTGSNSSGVGVGCSVTGAGSLTITGNIINGTRATGAYGTIAWTPGASNYLKVMYDGTNFYYFGPIDKTVVQSGTAVIDKEDGATTGTLTAGGGGAWGF